MILFHQKAVTFCLETLLRCGKPHLSTAMPKGETVLKSVLVVRTAVVVPLLELLLRVTFFMPSFSSQKPGLHVPVVPYNCATGKNLVRDHLVPLGHVVPEKIN